MAQPHLVREIIDGQTYWLSPSIPAVTEIALTAHLLPPYDEYTIGYKDRSAFLNPTYTDQVRRERLTAFIAIEGQIRGVWKRTFSKGAVVIAAPFTPCLPRTSRFRQRRRPLENFSTCPWCYHRRMIAEIVAGLDRIIAM
jgi:hypothetical protein